MKRRTILCFRIYENYIIIVFQFQGIDNNGTVQSLDKLCGRVVNITEKTKVYHYAIKNNTVVVGPCKVEFQNYATDKGINLEIIGKN